MSDAPTRAKHEVAVPILRCSSHLRPASHELVHDLVHVGLKRVAAHLCAGHLRGRTAAQQRAVEAGEV
jgi:hypothetical protein